MTQCRDSPLECCPLRRDKSERVYENKDDCLPRDSATFKQLLWTSRIISSALQSSAAAYSSSFLLLIFFSLFGSSIESSMPFSYHFYSSWLVSSVAFPPREAMLMCRLERNLGRNDTMIPSEASRCMRVLVILGWVVVAISNKSGEAEIFFLKISMIRRLCLLLLLLLLMFLEDSSLLCC